MSKIDILRKIKFGERVAEDESDILARYFVETEHWRRVYSGEVDVIYGPKGSGKSAIYSLLVARTDALFDRNIVLIPAENPRGSLAFRDLSLDPPTTEREFIALWKLYFVSLLHSIIIEYGISGDEVRQIGDALASAGLVRGGRSLQSLLKAVMDYVRRALRPHSFEVTVQVDPYTQLPMGFTGKITFAEPSTEAASKGYISVDQILSISDQILRGSSNFNVWILLDRLDVAFSENAELEKNALRALFRVYRDIMGFSNIKLKIFLRTDIWRRLTSGEFREASHITRVLTIDWDDRSLLNLMVRRSIYNDALIEYYNVTSEAVLSSTQSQEELFYRMCPQKIDIGRNKPKAFQWIIGRTRDATGKAAPRELIHLLNQLRDGQIRRLEVGDTEPEGELLFDRASFKDALHEVSRTRLEQTLYAEYPSLKQWLEKLRGSKTRQTKETLSEIWQISKEETTRIIEELVEAGFFLQQGKGEAIKYWIPFLYRDSLDLVQGTAG